MMKHAPAPWTCTHSPTINAYRIFDAHGNFHKDDETDHEANADLIAAAPELLEALEQAEMDMETFRLGMSAKDREYFKPCVSRVKAAIAKAKGE